MFTLSGSAIAYVSAAQPPPGSVESPDGVIQLANRLKPDQAPVSLTPQGEKWRVPSFAPTADANVLAAIKFGGADKLDGDVCIGAVVREGYLPKCLDDGGVSVQRVLRWAPNGKSLYAFGVKGTGGTFGMLRFTTKTETAFSPNADDWSKGKFITDISQTDKGVLDLAISPDGKRMAAISNFGASAAGFQLFFTKPGDWLLAKAKPAPVEACKMAWRPDSLELAVVQADNCQAGVGDIARIDARDPTQVDASSSSAATAPPTSRSSRRSRSDALPRDPLRAADALPELSPSAQPDGKRLRRVRHAAAGRRRRRSSSCCPTARASPSSTT